MWFLFRSLRSIYAARYRRVSALTLLGKPPTKTEYQVVYRLLILIWECFLPPTICSIATLVSYGIFAFSVRICAINQIPVLIRYLRVRLRIGTYRFKVPWESSTPYPSWFRCVSVLSRSWTATDYLSISNVNISYEAQEDSRTASVLQIDTTIALDCFQHSDAPQVSASVPLPLQPFNAHTACAISLARRQWTWCSTSIALRVRLEAFGGRRRIMVKCRLQRCLRLSLTGLLYYSPIHQAKIMCNR